MAFRQVVSRLADVLEQLNRPSPSA